MSRNDELNKQDWVGTILRILDEIGERIPAESEHLHERYLHHRFSHLIQQEEICTTDDWATKNGLFHPEWPTYKKATGIEFRKYKGVRPVDLDKPGKQGNIDFCIGTYESPKIAVEFKWGWSEPESRFDYLKLMDSLLPFEVGIAYGVIRRHGALSGKERLKRFQDSLQHAVENAKEGLKGHGGVAKGRSLYFLITEVAEDRKRHWAYIRDPNKHGEPSPFGTVEAFSDL